MKTESTAPVGKTGTARTQSEGFASSTDIKPASVSSQGFSVLSKFRKPRDHSEHVRIEPTVMEAEGNP